MSRASPPWNNSLNSRSKFAFTLAKDSTRRSRPSRFSDWMPRRKRSIAPERSARSEVKVCRRCSNSAASSSARRLTPPSCSRSRFNFSTRSSASSSGGNSTPAFNSARSISSFGAESSSSRMRVLSSVRRAAAASARALAPARSSRASASTASAAFARLVGFGEPDFRLARASAACLRAASAASIAPASAPRRSATFAGAASRATSSSRIWAMRTVSSSMWRREASRRADQRSISAAMPAKRSSL